MKKKILGLVTAAMVFTVGFSFAVYPLQDNCPYKGRVKCKPVVQKKINIPPCCQKAQSTASAKKVAEKY